MSKGHWTWNSDFGIVVKGVCNIERKYFRLVSPFYSEEEEGKYQELLQSFTTPDPGNHLGKWQKHKQTSQTRESRGQTFPGRWSQDCKEQTRQHNKDKHKP